MDALTPFEHDAIDAIVSPEHPVFAALRAQLGSCGVSKREFTGVGFFTSLAVAPEIPSAPVRGRLHLGDVEVSAEGLAHGIGLVLFVEEGRLDVLEGFTYDEPWPKEIVNYSIRQGGVTHVGGAQTDLEQVEDAWLRRGGVT
jgi:hypothetical protein